MKYISIKNKVLSDKNVSCIYLKPLDTCLIMPYEMHGTLACELEMLCLGENIDGGKLRKKDVPTLKYFPKEILDWFVNEFNNFYKNKKESYVSYVEVFSSIGGIVFNIYDANKYKETKNKYWLACYFNIGFANQLNDVFWLAKEVCKENSLVNIISVDCYSNEVYAKINNVKKYGFPDSKKELLKLAEMSEADR